MLRRSIVTLFAIAFTALAAEKSGFVGTWEGQANGLPAVELTVRQDSGAVNGSIGFYFQTRGEDGKWRLGEKTTLPLLSPKIAGSILTFETIHHKTHGSPELGPNNRYRVEQVSPNELRLNILKDNETPKSGSGLKLTRAE